MEESFTIALGMVQNFKSANLTEKIAQIERNMCLSSKGIAENLNLRNGISLELLKSAFIVKAASAQINVVIHAVGILYALPYILDVGERVESLSLGAGNTGKAFDLETNVRIGNFKFINWRGGSESIRQNTLFVDFFKLAVEKTTKRKCLYVLNKQIPIRFFQNNRDLKSVLSKNIKVFTDFQQMFGDRYRTVSQFYQSYLNAVEIIDLLEILPSMRELEELLRA